MKSLSILAAACIGLWFAILVTGRESPVVRNDDAAAPSHYPASNRQPITPMPDSPEAVRSRFSAVEDDRLMLDECLDMLRVDTEARRSASVVAEGLVVSPQSRFPHAPRRTSVFLSIEGRGNLSYFVGIREPCNVFDVEQSLRSIGEGRTVRRKLSVSYVKCVGADVNVLGGKVHFTIRWVPLHRWPQCLRSSSGD